MTQRTADSGKPSSTYMRVLTTLLLSASTAAIAPSAFGQTPIDETQREDTVIATGIRQALSTALIEKRNADSLVEIINAEEIGKLPDQNLAEVLENITGIQITRTNGVGTGVQIRGTDANLTLINGVNTVGSGTGRTGINFTDINPAIIAGLEVTKSPQASSLEGAVGGIINLRTIRPLELNSDKPLLSARVQGELSNLSDGGVDPRISGAIGNKWDNAEGQEIGFVLSGSYTESTNTSFLPRRDLDNLTTCDGASFDRPSCPDDATSFLGVQFLNQVQETQNFETINVSGSVEAKPTDSTRVYLDVIHTDQTRRLAGSRVQFSNVSRLNGDGQSALNSNNNNTDFENGEFADSNINFTGFENFDLGEDAIGQDLGSTLVATQGTFTPCNGDEEFECRGAPFLRGSSDNGSRETISDVVRFGGEWDATDSLSLSAEYSRVRADTVNPQLSSTINFINPNVGVAPSSFSDLGVAGANLRDENGIPIVFDLSDDTLAFGINFADPLAPTVEQLLDPNNYVFDGSPTFSANELENIENAYRLDASYNFEEKGVPFFNSVDVGYRYNKRDTRRDNIRAGTSGSGTLQNSLNIGGIAQLTAPIPDNFGDGTGSDLFVGDLLHIDPNIVDDPQDTVDAINAAAAAQGLGPIFTSQLASVAGDFFDIEENTDAIYGQINFGYDFGNGFGFRGNGGVRYVDTQISSTANQFTDGVAALTTIDTDYDFFLPRVNLIVDVGNDIKLRGGYSQEILRPNFDLLTSGREFPLEGGVNSPSEGGNPFLRPEEVDAFDVSAEWYFAPEALFSVGYFRKERNERIADLTSVAAVDENGLRDVTAPCEGGGIFSPGTSPGIFGDEAQTGLGVCVDDVSFFNSDGETTQQGVEVSLQYNLGQFEDSLGFLSGFGIIANYTYQTEDNNTDPVVIDPNRARAIFTEQGFDFAQDADGNFIATPVFREEADLLNLSRNAFNITGFYEKFGISARARYTYRTSFRTDNLPGTGAERTPLGFRGTQEARGQLNASLAYDITDQLTIQAEGVNLTKSSADIFCTPDTDLICYQGITDRRIQFGANFTF